MKTTRQTAVNYIIWLMVLGTAPAFAENWPGFRGPGRQGISQEKNVPVEWSQTANIVWKTPIPGEGWSSPIVFEDNIFVTTATENGVSFHLLRINRKNGAVLWDKELFRQKAGHKQQFNSYASSTPVTDGQKVFVVGADGTIAAVSMDGNVIWTNHDIDFYSEHGLAVSPVLYEDLVIVAFDPSSSGPDPKLGWQKPWDQAVIKALDKNTGKVRWEGKRGLSCVSHVSPQILHQDGKDRLISSAGGVIQGFDLQTGRRIWTVSSPGEGVVPSVVIGEGLVFTASGFGASTIRVVRMGGEGDVTATHIAWESTDDVPKVPSMLYARPFLFLITETGVAKCLRAATGEVIWRERMDPKYSASPVWAEGRIYFLSEKGTTTVIEAGPEFKIIARNMLGEKCCASPAVSQKQIFIRSEHNLFCIGAKLSDLSDSSDPSDLSGGTSSAQTHHVWEKVEITLHAIKSYQNPYTDVEVWADLKGPGFDRRCYGFWDGDNTFRIRVTATAPGTWTWRTGLNQDDAGLKGKTGSFAAIAWDDAAKKENPCRRGMIKASANGHAFEYADGTPYFLVGDTWWATPTFRFPWYDDDKSRPMGPSVGFKDYVRFRKDQGFNCVAMIAAFPNWANDGKTATLKADDGTILRAAWQQPGTKSAKDMHDEDGNRAFLFPGKVAGYENIFPDLDRINPKYFQNLDRKIDYLNANSFVPFIEVSRRDIGQGWKKYYPWPESYIRYIQYVWARYQANICLFSPIHFDTPSGTIPAADYNQAANKLIEQYGHPPFGTLAGTNSNPSTLRNFGHVDKAKWLTFHQIGNRRTHNNYAYLTEIFNASPPVPGINGEPYYAGMNDAPGGTPTSALYCRSGMYGSVLSGGFGGHIYGAGGWDGGLWGGNVEEAAENHIWDAMKWPSADQMRHLAAFILSAGRRYQDLIPGRELLKPNESGEPEGFTGWAYCARNAQKDLFLLYFEKDCPKAVLSGAVPTGKYQAKWFNTQTGDWTDAGIVTANSSGNISLPDFPDSAGISTTDWALKLTLQSERSKE